MSIESLMTESITVSGVGGGTYPCFRFISKRQHNNNQDFNIATDELNPVFMVRNTIVGNISINQTFAYNSVNYRVQSIVNKIRALDGEIYYVEIKAQRLGIL